MRRPQFRLRTLLEIMALVGVLVSWWVDRRRLETELNELKDAQRQLVTELEKSNNAAGRLRVVPQLLPREPGGRTVKELIDAFEKPQLPFDLPSKPKSLAQ